MKRINAYYTEQQIAQLDALHRETGMTVSEHLRRAVDAYLQDLRTQGFLNNADLQVPTQATSWRPFFDVADHWRTAQEPHELSD